MSSSNAHSTNNKNERNILAVLEQAGYRNHQKVVNTLQGSIWSATQIASNRAVIIKVTSRKLHKESMIVVGGRRYNVEENIIKEKEILRTLTSEKCKECNKQEIEEEELKANEIKNGHQHCGGQQHVIQYIDFFKSNTNFYFVMSNGGHMLFDFVLRVHRYIDSQKLEISEWQKFVKVIFKQLLSAISYIHGKNVCHYDISLENLLINDIEVVLDSNGKIKFCTDNVTVKLCDFGLAEQYLSDTHFESTKFCGKPNYKSPECTNKAAFNAKANDVWCVGVCLFMMLIGGNMCNKADVEDQSFTDIMNGDIDKLLTKWGRLQYVNHEIIDLLCLMLQYEEKRSDLDTIRQHPWLLRAE